MRYSLPSIKCSPAPLSFRLLPSARLSNHCAEFRQRIEFGSSRKLGGPAEHLIDGSEKRICRLSFQGAFVWDQSGIRITAIMRVCVCLGAILIPESLDFHSGYSAPWSRIAARSRIAGRARIITSLFSLETKMASCSSESVEAAERRKGFWWSREDTLLLISQYREHEKLFRNVNCKKKSVQKLHREHTNLLSRERE